MGWKKMHTLLVLFPVLGFWEIPAARPSPFPYSLTPSSSKHAGINRNSLTHPEFKEFSLTMYSPKTRGLGQRWLDAAMDGPRVGSSQNWGQLAALHFPALMPPPTHLGLEFVVTCFVAGGSGIKGCPGIITDHQHLLHQCHTSRLCCSAYRIRYHICTQMLVLQSSGHASGLSGCVQCHRWEASPGVDHHLQQQMSHEPWEGSLWEYRMVSATSQVVAAKSWLIPWKTYLWGQPSLSTQIFKNISFDLMTANVT